MEVPKEKGNFKKFLNNKLGKEYSKESQLRMKYERPIFYTEEGENNPSFKQDISHVYRPLKKINDQSFDLGPNSSMTKDKSFNKTQIKSSKFRFDIIKEEDLPVNNNNILPSNLINDEDKNDEDNDDAKSIAHSTIEGEFFKKNKSKETFKTAYKNDDLNISRVKFLENNNNSFLIDENIEHIGEEEGNKNQNPNSNFTKFFDSDGFRLVNELNNKDNQIVEKHDANTVNETNISLDLKEIKENQENNENNNISNNNQNMLEYAKTPMFKSENKINFIGDSDLIEDDTKHIKEFKHESLNDLITIKDSNKNNINQIKKICQTEDNNNLDYDNNLNEIINNVNSTDNFKNKENIKINSGHYLSNNDVVMNDYNNKDNNNNKEDGKNDESDKLKITSNEVDRFNNNSNLDKEINQEGNNKCITSMHENQKLNNNSIINNSNINQNNVNMKLDTIQKINNIDEINDSDTSKSISRIKTNLNNNTENNNLSNPIRNEENNIKNNKSNQINENIYNNNKQQPITNNIIKKENALDNDNNISQHSFNSSFSINLGSKLNGKLNYLNNHNSNLEMNNFENESISSTRKLSNNLNNNKINKPIIPLFSSEDQKEQKLSSIQNSHDNRLKRELVKEIFNYNREPEILNETKEENGILSNKLNIHEIIKRKVLAQDKNQSSKSQIDYTNTRNKPHDKSNNSIVSIIIKKGNKNESFTSNLQSDKRQSKKFYPEFNEFLSKDQLSKLKGMKENKLDFTGLYNDISKDLKKDKKEKMSKDNLISNKSIISITSTTENAISYVKDKNTPTNFNNSSNILNVYDNFIRAKKEEKDKLNNTKKETKEDKDNKLIRGLKKDVASKEIMNKEFLTKLVSKKQLNTEATQNNQIQHTPREILEIKRPFKDLLNNQSTIDLMRKNNLENNKFNLAPTNQVPFQLGNSTNVDGFNVDVFVKKSIKESRYYNKSVADEYFSNYIYDNSSYLHFTGHKVEFEEKDIPKLDNIHKLHIAHVIQKKDKVEVYNKIENHIMSNPFIKSNLIINDIIETTAKVDLDKIPTPWEYMGMKSSRK